MEGHGGGAWTRLAFSSESEWLKGQYRSWGGHLELGTNLLTDTFLQGKSWADELLAVAKGSVGRLLLVGGAVRTWSWSGVSCSEAAALWGSHGAA